MLLPKPLVVLGISFSLLALSTPINCPIGAPCVPIPWREDTSKRSPDIPQDPRRSNTRPNPYPGPTFPDPPRPFEERSAEPEPDQFDGASQPEKRQKTTGTWPYYGYPVKAPTKIQRSAEPVVEPEPENPHPRPQYLYQDRDVVKREAEPVEGPYHPLPPHYVYPDPAPEKREAAKLPGNPLPPHYLYPNPAPEKREAANLPSSPLPPHYRYPNPASEKREAAKPPGNPRPPYYLYQDPAVEKRTADDAPKPTPTATPYYGYPANDRRDAAPEPNPTESGTPYYGYRAPA